MASKREVDPTKPVVTNAASGKQLREAKKRIRARKIYAKQDMLDILRIPAARRYLWKLLGDCGIHSSTFSQDTGLMAYKSGMQDIGHRILADVTGASPEAFLLMMRENR